MDKQLTAVPRYWQAVLARDARFDGKFVYAVRSTGVYCRPSCASRRPGRQQTLFFPQPEAAEQAGFRACLRCRPREAATKDPQAELVRRACHLIEENLESLLTLAELGAQLAISPYHLQRSFKRAMGITPRQYADARRLATLKAELKGGRDVTTALYEAGYGSSSRLYERAPAQLGMTPATYRRGGRGMKTSFAIAASPLGHLLVAATERGVCAVSLGDADAELETALRREYPQAEIARDERQFNQWVKAVLDYCHGEQPCLNLPLDIRATAFQWRVWQALQEIPRGSTRSYGQVARDIGRPTATRAVARACAANPTALVIPCHRVVREDGELGGYRWGIERKRALLEREGKNETGGRGDGATGR